ncbi:hypothetical protein SPBR_08919 [Sporothrix brasiliensis 5110]|uniref:Zn(2)-C6 fungal-type domain-containing protein n=1 Tax=Sporothrix brasiliensis 5110 TaxID=1398154 RepID=A0A0C2IFH7_9PEZI|nr:uncharacterized protein SPBR_08919 [Sporothrix brasiliensis 5110]KIH87976.1 hypothetical protein SPBR_08919 [Sporothrix brasiliensis 5110]
MTDREQITPQKRMRLGTRSCAECRRRKVRCVFQEESAVCVACMLHGVTCRAQQPATALIPAPKTARAANIDNGSTRTGEEGSSLALLQKLDEMESMIKEIRGSGALTGASTVATGSKSLSSGISDELEEAERRRLLSTAATTPSPSNSGLEPNRTKTAHHSATDALDAFGNTPLVTLFREALRLPESHGSSDGAAAKISTSPELPTKGPALFQQPCVTGFSRSMLLTDACLRAVVDATTSCFAVFPPCALFQQPAANHTPAVTPTMLNTADAATATADIRAALWSDNVDAAAKAVVLVALCLYELPQSWTAQYTELADTRSLIDIYRRQAARMLSILSENGNCTRDGVEARCLQVKLNVDLGLPRRAWLTARKAVSDCLILGYHRAGRQGKPHEQTLWNFAVHIERETSMIMGMPSSICGHAKYLLPILPMDDISLIPEFRLLHEMTSLLGAVIDHYQTIMAPPPPGVVTTDNLGPNYAKTFELDQAWESCRQIMPAVFWLEDHTSPAIRDLSFVDLSIRQTTKMRYFIIGRHIHLPYVLKAKNDRRYMYSRTTCLDASRETIAAYQVIRNRGNETWSPCGMIDFETFSAAMVLALAMLQDSPSNCASGSRERTRQEVEDYNLLVDLSLSLRKTHLLRGSCTVAHRAADVMDIILPILQGQYRRSTQVGAISNTTTADHDINIPFFGRLRVTFSHVDVDESLNQSLSPFSVPQTRALDGTDLSGTSQPARIPYAEAPPAIEFGVPFCNLDFHNNFDFDLELNADWMNGDDMGIYDWTTMLAPGLA